MRSFILKLAVPALVIVASQAIGSTRNDAPPPPPVPPPFVPTYVVLSGTEIYQGNCTDGLVVDHFLANLVPVVVATKTCNDKYSIVQASDGTYATVATSDLTPLLLKATANFLLAGAFTYGGNCDDGMIEQAEQPQDLAVTVTASICKGAYSVVTDVNGVYEIVRTTDLATKP